MRSEGLERARRRLCLQAELLGFLPAPFQVTSQAVADFLLLFGLGPVFAGPQRQDGPLEGAVRPKQYLLSTLAYWAGDL